ncbi:hypothetical protein Hanom_Chr14g01252601 [Helianthus anomalus]
MKTGPVKPSEKAAGLKQGGNCSVLVSGLNEGTDSDLGSSRTGPGLLNGVDFPPLRAEDLGRSQLDPPLGSGCLGSDVVGVAVGRPYPGLVNDPVLEPVIKQKEPKGGTGYFDTSVGVRASPNLNTKNTFDVLQDEVEHFNTKIGLWDHEVEVVKKYSNSSSSPPDVIYEAWNESLKKFYQELTKNVVNSVGKNADDEVEVESETDETARFMKLNS